MPELDFSILNVEAPPYHAVPTLLFKLQVRNRTPEPIHSVMLKVQVQIMAEGRPYNGEEQERLRELFGRPEQWARSLKSLPWTQSVVLVPAFTGETVVDVPVTCTYDFELLSSRYFWAAGQRQIPLTFLFSGTIFYKGSVGLQAAQISWDKEAAFRLRPGLWQEMMDHYFPNSAWLRLRKELFDALSDYKVAHSLPSWEAVIEQLLARAQEEAEA